MSGSRTCLACSGPMEPGFVPTSKGGASMFPAAWHPGAPDADKSFWEKVTTGAEGAKIDPDQLVPILAHRCSECGLLQLYAS